MSQKIPVVFTREALNKERERTEQRQSYFAKVVPLGPGANDRWLYGTEAATARLLGERKKCENVS